MKHRNIILLWLMWMFIIIGTVALVGCKTKYITVPDIRTEYHDRTDSIYLHDSIHVKDSVIMYMQGDTMFKTIYLNKYVFRDRWRTKTDSFVKVDSVRVPYPVERKLTAWEQVRLRLFVPLVCLVAIIVLMLVWLFKRKELF